MATKFQYDAFKDLYDEEQARGSRLTTTGQVYVAICSAFITGVGAKLTLAGTAGAGRLWFVLAATALLLAIGFVVSSLGTFVYWATFDPDKALKALKSDMSCDDEFFDDQLQEITDSYRRNEGMNNRRARLLTASAVAMMAAALLALIGFVVPEWKCVPN